MKRGRGDFRTGPTGVCEATLFEFRSDTGSSQLEADDPRHMIAANSLLEAAVYMAKREPEFVVRSVRSLGVIVLLSGSPFQ